MCLFTYSLDSHRRAVEDRLAAEAGMEADLYPEWTLQAIELSDGPAGRGCIW